MADDDKKAKAEQINAALAKAELSRENHDGEQLDKLLKGIDALTKTCDALNKRMDAVEAGAPGDGKHVPRHVGKDADAADDGIPDPDNPGKSPTEPKRVVADSDRVQHILADSERKRDERAAIADAQANADMVCQSWSGSARPPMQGERLLDYRRRLLRPWMGYSKEFRDVEVNTLDEPLLTPIERRVFADAIAASDPSIAPEGQLRCTRRRDQTGREIYEYHGEPKSWMAAFAGQRRRVIGIKTTTSP